MSWSALFAAIESRREDEVSQRLGEGIVYELSRLTNSAHASKLVARERFELSSEGPKPSMLVHYTTGLLHGYTRNHRKNLNTYVCIV